MKKVLSINRSPTFRTYTYHAYYHAIVTAPSRFGDKVAQIRVTDFEKETWSKKVCELEISQKNNMLTFCSLNKFNQELNACYWRQLNSRDEIDITIEYQQYTNPWGAINIFVTDKNQKDMLEDDKFWFRIGQFCKDGIYARIDNIQQKLNLERKHEGEKVNFKLVVANGCVCALVNGKEVLSKEYPNTVKEDDLCIGFEIKLNDNIYFPWLFSNYIQVYSNLNGTDEHIDYFGRLRKNWNYYTSDYFLDYDRFTYDSISMLGISLLDFIKKNINQEKYIEVWINQKFLKNRWEYKKQLNHFHQNLIYGYDDVREILYLVGYCNRIPCTTEISYSDFCCEQNIDIGNRNLVVLTYNPDSVVFEFSPVYFKQILLQYLKSQNSYLAYGSQMSTQVKSFGLNVYEQLCTEKGLEVLFRDVRIIHFLVEHKKCMQERIDYLLHNDFLAGDFWLEGVEKILSLANNLEMIVLLGKAKKSLKYRLHAKDILREMQEFERVYYCKLVDALEIM